MTKRAKKKTRARKAKAKKLSVQRAHKKTTDTESLELATQHMQAGRLAEAETFCRQVLQTSPNLHQAHHLLGIIAYNSGNLQAAVEHFSRAIAIDPTAERYHTLVALLASLGRFEEAENAARKILAIEPRNAEAENNLGNVLKEQGRLEEAIQAYQRALAIRPDFADAHSNLGNALRTKGCLEEAAIACRRALEIRPDFAEAENNLSNVLFSQGRLEEAEQASRRALRIQPRYAIAQSNLGNALEAQGRQTEAIEAFQRALALQPNCAEAECGLANAFYAQGRMQEAEQAYRRALQIRPNYAEAENNLGNVFKEMCRFEEAVQSYQRALTIQPNFAGPHSNLGSVLGTQGRLAEAAGACRRALQIQPNFPEAENNLGLALQGEGNIEEAVGAYRRALEIQPNFPGAHSNLVYIQNFFPDVTLSALAASHAEWDQRHAAPLESTWRSFSNSPEPNRRLRLGFVASNFRRHPCGYFLIRGLESWDVENFETVLYSDQVTKDDLTDRFAAAAGTWREVRGLADQKLADLIRADQIDILIGMAGHTLGNRLLMLARKPAPILVSWTGYAGSTGLSAIDYLLADRFHIPEELEGEYREKIIRLPDGYVSYDPPNYAPPVGPLPAERNGYVTFGSFNQAAKYNSEVVAVWSQILHRLPDSRLVLKCRGLADQSMRRRLGDLFAAHDVDASRLELQGSSPHAELLAEYERIDITLSPFPFSGGVTTCESIWMGVPVITWPGETFASRHSLSHLSNIGSTETIAKDLPEYVEIAVGLGQNIPHLAELRAGLRQRMAQSPLCDGKRFAKNLQQALRTVWHDWCATIDDHISLPQVRRSRTGETLS